MSAWSERPLLFECEGDALIGIVASPAQSSAHRVGVLVIVGGPQYRVGSHRQFTLMAREFAQAGFHTLRFDYRGMGDSEGAMRTFEAVGADIKAAIDAFMKAVPSLQQVVLWGLCDAASASLMYCRADSRVRGLILANPWVRTPAGEAQAFVRHYYMQRLLQPGFWRKVLAGQFQLLGSARDLLAKLGRMRRRPEGAQANVSFLQRMLEGLQEFKGPVLFLISERDLTAREFTDLCGQSQPWQRSLAKPAVCTADLPGADHTFSTRHSLREATRRCQEWLAEKAGP